jgi:hypothetical protein
VPFKTTDPIEYSEENDRRVDSASPSCDRGGIKAGSGSLNWLPAGGIFVASNVGVLSASVGFD